jgi:hypothetical protein
MQTHIAKQLPSLKVGFADPQLIAQATFTYPKLWRLDGKELEAGKTNQEKEQIRAKAIREASTKVAAIICTIFRRLQHNDTIWLPYHYG